MGEVLAFKKPRNKTIRGHARECLSEAMKTAGKPMAVVVIALGHDGAFAVRSAFEQELELFDVYARAEALAGREKQACIADE